MTDPRYTPKSLADVLKEFRDMKAAALERQEFEAAAACETFAKAVEAAQLDIKRLRHAVDQIGFRFAGTADDAVSKRCLAVLRGEPINALFDPNC